MPADIQAVRDGADAIDGIKVDEAGRLAHAGRTDMVRVQTPQAFRAAPLLAAYAASRAGEADGTDTAGVVERHGDLVVKAIPGSEANLKVTFAADVPRAEALLGWKPQVHTPELAAIMVDADRATT